MVKYRYATESTHEALLGQDHPADVDVGVGRSVHDSDCLYQFRRYARYSLAYWVGAFLNASLSSLPS